MLFTQHLKIDTKRETIFEDVRNYFSEKNIPLENIMDCVTDGAAEMSGRHRGFIAHFQNAVPEVFCMHLLIHRQHLLRGRLHDSPAVVEKKTVCQLHQIKLSSRGSFQGALCGK